MRTTSLICLFVIAAAVTASAQSGREYRRSNVMSGNRVKTVFGNWGVIGQPPTGGPRGSWIYDNDGYLGDVSPFVGAEVISGGKTFHSVVTAPVDRPTKRRDESPGGKAWTWEPVAGYFNANQQGVALYTNSKTWPEIWPDKLGDMKDPGWRGSWNGYFGKASSADEESYFVMDDNNDERFNFPLNNALGVAFKPDSRNPSRNGLALEMRVRALQWKQFLAQDNVFWLYEIKNTGTTDYTRTVFGMLVGTYVGVTGNDGTPQEYDDDFSLFDISRSLTYTGDYPDNNGRNPSWVGPVGLVGYAFLESPGNPYDAIDNDNDAGFNAAPLFSQASFDSTLITAGATLVIIADDYKRSTTIMPATQTVVQTRGASIDISPGVTILAEGNLVRDAQNNLIVNPNAYDGVDNDLDGIIDENYYLHYRQYQVDTQGNILIDNTRPVHHLDYKSGASTHLMIDERRDDLIDNDADWNIDFDDVGRDGVGSTSDFGESDGSPTSGYDAGGNDTGLPGEPNIDKTDVDESDQIGLTSFQYFTPAGDISLGDDEDLWKRLAPGFFAVPRSIVQGLPTRGEDGDFIYGSGYFPLRAGTIERFSLALVYGGGAGGYQSDLTELHKHLATVRKIYNSNYRFPVAPDKPTLRAVPGDRSVTLYWDRRAEKSFDPVLREYDFEGYKIYRATDPNFNDAAKITDANGIIVDYKPIAQFDLKNDVRGYFRPGPDLFEMVSGLSFYLGGNSGLVHTWTDTDVDNGRTYYYAVVAYDRGNEATDIFPAENSKRIQLSATAPPEFDINTASVVPNAPVAGYAPPQNYTAVPSEQSFATGTLGYETLDPLKLLPNTYRVTFTDITSDGIDNDTNGKTDADDPNEVPQVTATYTVENLTQQRFSFAFSDTLRVKLPNANINPASVLVKDAGGPVDPSKYVIDARRGDIRASSSGIVSGPHEILYTYYPVWRSPNIKNSPYSAEALDADIFDGLQLSFANDWQIFLREAESGFNTPDTKRMIFTFSTTDVLIGPGDTLKGRRYPSDYSIVFSSRILDTSAAMYGSPATPVNFTVLNRTEGHTIPFIFTDNDRNAKLSSSDELSLFDLNRNGNPVFTWTMSFVNRPTDPPDMVFDFTDGDTLLLRTTKPFRNGDIYTFAPTLPKVENTLSRDQLANVKVVPNPYIGANIFESPLPPGITTGRGERKVDFIHLPVGAKVNIFTARGEHVITLAHESPINDGTVTWNLKSKENLDIAYGVYFYIVESPVGSKTGKLAIIK